MLIKTQQSTLDQIARSLGNKGNAIAYEQITVTTLTNLPNLPATATGAILILESTVAAPTTSIRYREDGGAPTSTVGMPVVDGTIFAIEGYQNLVNFKAIASGAGTYLLNVQYYR